MWLEGNVKCILAHFYLWSLVCLAYNEPAAPLYNAYVLIALFSWQFFLHFNFIVVYIRHETDHCVWRWRSAWRCSRQNYICILMRNGFNYWTTATNTKATTCYTEIKKSVVTIKF